MPGDEGRLRQVVGAEEERPVEVGDGERGAVVGQAERDPPHRHRRHVGGRGADRQLHGGGGRDNGAALIGLGIGLFALGAIAASSQRDRGYDRYYDRYDYGPPPPPAYRSRYGGYGYHY